MSRRPTRDRQPAQQDAEDEDQHQRQPEDRDGLAEDGDRQRRAVDPAIGAQRRDNAERYRYHECQDQRRHSDGDGDADALGDEVRHLLVGEQRAAEIAPQQVADPVEILDRQRPIEAVSW